MDKAALDVAVPGAQTRYPVEYTATAGEYFRIWIVNLALTIVTIGIYSAWAKVRKRRYFYAHTHIDGATVSNADPITGQAGWYDVRVRIRRADRVEPKMTSPQFRPVAAAPGTATGPRPKWQAFFAGRSKAGPR